MIKPRQCLFNMYASAIQAQRNLASSKRLAAKSLLPAPQIQVNTKENKGVKKKKRRTMALQPHCAGADKRCQHR
jgi:hypothetical protein